MIIPFLTCGILNRISLTVLVGLSYPAECLTAKLQKLWAVLTVYLYENHGLNFLKSPTCLHSRGKTLPEEESFHGAWSWTSEGCLHLHLLLCANKPFWFLICFCPAVHRWLPVPPMSLSSSSSTPSTAHPPQRTPPLPKYLWQSCEAYARLVE